MDRNIKFLKLLSEKEFESVQKALIKISNNDLSDLNIKKLSGHKNIYRARVGKTRIIFIIKETEPEILEIGRRSEKTYKQY